MQIFEGTNQVQRMVISRDLRQDCRRPAGPFLSRAAGPFLSRAAGPVRSFGSAERMLRSPAVATVT